jgi:hypothetical protein
MTYLYGDGLGRNKNFLLLAHHTKQLAFLYLPQKLYRKILFFRDRRTFPSTEFISIR